MRVLVCDGSVIVREGVRAILARQPDLSVVAEAREGRQALALAREHRPDVLLADIHLPSPCGLELCAALAEELPDCRVILMAERCLEEDARRAERAGARAFLPKCVSLEELVGAVRAVRAGRRIFPSRARAGSHVGATGAALTRRELEVLGLIVRGKSNRKVGAALGITEGTVKGHVNNILGKLGVADRTQAAVAALARGIVHLD